MQNPGLFGTFTVLSPPIADFIAASGYDTLEKLDAFVTAPDPNENPKAASKSGSAAAKSPPGAAIGDFTVVVTGSRNNNYWMIGGMRVFQSIQIDPWR